MLPVIGKLLRHSGNETTARYAHLAQEPIHESAAARIVHSIAADILWRTPHGLQPRTLVRLHSPGHTDTAESPTRDDRRVPCA